MAAQGIQTAAVLLTSYWMFVGTFNEKGVRQFLAIAAALAALAIGTAMLFDVLGLPHIPAG